MHLNKTKEIKNAYTFVYIRSFVGINAYKIHYLFSYQRHGLGNLFIRERKRNQFISVDSVFFVFYFISMGIYLIIKKKIIFTCNFSRNDAFQMMTSDQRASRKAVLLLEINFRFFFLS